MALNITAQRTLSLAGFANGWDDAYILVRTATEKERREYITGITEINAKVIPVSEDGDSTEAIKNNLAVDAEIEQFARTLAAKVIVGGKVMTTLDDGSQELVPFSKSDTPVVLEALSFGWVNEVIDTAVGGTGPKAKAS